MGSQIGAAVHYRLQNMRLFFYIFLILHVQFHHHHHRFTMAEEDEDVAVVAVVNSTSTLENFSKKDNQPLPVQTRFQFPSPLPAWPKGGGFGSGVIDLGGLKVCQVSTFNKVWASLEGGFDNVGATFFEPTSIPEGFFMLGSYTQPNNIPLFGWVLAAKDSSHDQSILKNPIDYTLVWSSESVKINQDGVGYIWLPIPPDGYKSVGHVVTSTPGKPSLDKIRCVHANFTDAIDNGEWIWGHSDGGLNVYAPRPGSRGPGASGVSAGTFLVTLNGGPASAQFACLKNVAANFSGMPNLAQVQALVQEYSPRLYFHPDESFLPSSVNWFFQKGALLYTKGQENSPVPVSINGSNLPQGGSNDGTYWIDLPTDGSAKDKVKQGSIQDARVYLHIKPMFGATFTDICVWVFYPFNGAARAKIEFITIKLGKIGEHVGDWEHVTLRISNFNGELKRVYFSQHSGGNWVEASQLEYEPNGNKPVVYSSLHGHAAYPNAGAHLQGNGNGNGENGIGIRNDTGKGDNFLDVGNSFEVVCADYLGSIVVEPPWLNYAREWGPKISYDIDDELRKVKKWLPGKLKKAIDKIVNGIPREVLGEEGPTGPRWKDNWDGDERS
ncbi:OLC1v1001722C4 [Oldenlandia corymbosa var. corymbosa]|uniref:OLC1v1001722C4 n=1 Tax=Oldenlandia corymbosa var. corymbosa TaxID=529605 RepID=A0AAV1D663_OLDCO|nr:OLC1v1001722C4 [Oldenlandia corymbosa var. corymbosa]